MNRNIKLIITIVILIVLIILIILSLNQYNENYNFKIYFFNAGKADAIVISYEDKYIMIDTGEESLADDILNYFKENNITKLDYLIITHFDKDHVGSASKVIDNIEIDNILQSNVEKNSEYYNNYINSMNKKNIQALTVSGNYEFNLGEINVIVNGPTDIYENNESNNSSLIVSIKYQNKSFLFTGDAMNARIKDFLKNNNNTYDFIKIPYHGNYLKRLDDLLESTNSKYGVITSSDKEKEDDETIELLDKYNIKYYLTREGNITITSNGNNIKINQ